ncbi:MAG: holo-ACP synthase [Bacillales bacterium]
MSLGIDLTSINRFKNKDKLAEKILSEEEFVLYKNHFNKAQYLASRWCLKEAFIKAVKNSIKDLNLKDIIIKNENNGAIYIDYKSKKYDCSLSHERNYCVGVVFIND